MTFGAVEPFAVGLLVAASVAWLARLVLSHPTIVRLRDPEHATAACGSCPSGGSCATHERSAHASAYVPDSR